LEWIKLFKLYNLRMLRSRRLLYAFLVLSVVIAVSIALAIPQIMARTELALNGQAAELNGAGLRVEAEYESRLFQDELEKLRVQGITVRTTSVYSSPFQNGTKQTYADILAGDYDLPEDGILLYAALAEELKVKEGDTVAAAGRTYRVAGIEKAAYGVDGQSEMLGYGKVKVLEGLGRVPFSTLFLIDGGDSAQLKEQLKRVEPQFRYSTVEDQKATINFKLNNNAAALTILHTLSYFMTLLSVLSSILMIIMHRQRDTAIIRLLGVPVKALQTALRAELCMLIVPAVCAGALLSLPAANYLLLFHGVPDSSDSSGALRIAGSGALMFAVIYVVFIFIATRAIKAVHPMAIVRGDAVSWKQTRRSITWLSLGFGLVTLFVYAVYVGRASALFSSLLILLFTGLFFAVALLGVRLISVWPYRSRLLLYSSRNLRANRHSFAVTVFSLGLTILFLLIGFTLDQTIRDSFNQGTESKLSYNYLVSTGDPAGLEQALRTTADVTGYTKLYQRSGFLTNQEGMRRPVQLSSLKPEEYQLRYQLLEGEDVFEGRPDEVLVSSEFRNRLGVGIGEVLKAEIGGKPVELRIKGIYEAGGLNQWDVLQPSGAGGQYERVMYLVKAGSGQFKEGLGQMISIHVGIQGEFLAKMISDFLAIFKWLCGVCIFSSILFNLNLVYMGMLQDYREGLIIGALGLGDGFLSRYAWLKAAVSLVFSLLLSLGLYAGLLKLALSLMMHIDISLAPGTVLLPVGSAILLTAVIFLLPSRLWRQRWDFRELGGMV
jgi:putative ABC transport system permease protein